MSQQTTSGPCHHYARGIGTFPLPKPSRPAFVAIEHCNVCETMVGNLDDVMPPLVFGPDGRLVARETCTLARFEGSCLPSLVKDGQEIPEEMAQEPATALRSLAAHLRSESWRVRAKAHRALDHAVDIRHRAQVALERSLALHARSQGLFAAAA